MTRMNRLIPQLLIVLAVAPAAGQELGERVRVTLDSDRVLIGLVTGLDANTLVLARTDGESQSVLRNQITLAERAVQGHRGRRGAIAGAAVVDGLLLLLVIGFSGVDESTPGFGSSGGINLDALVTTLMVGGGIGGGLGYLIGRGFRFESWQPISLAPPSLTFDNRGRLTTTMTFRF